MDRLRKLWRAGQSIWLDNINRPMILSGELERMIDRGEIRGVTSNPTIFNNAISRSSDYDSAIQSMSWAGWDVEDIFWQLAKEDICSALNFFQPLYDKVNGRDGFVSLEVDPRWADDGPRMLQQAETLWKEINKPNLMIKIPGTLAGLRTIRSAISRGVNVNVTLIFSIDRYRQIINAYFQALEARIAKNLPINQISSVASFFVSRVDTKVDFLLCGIIEKKGKNAETARKLLGKASIANTKMAYQVFKEAFSSERFKKLKEKGAQIQRPLWASTSTKNPAYKDTLYIDELVAPDTVNTLPQQTLVAVKDHGLTELSIERDLEEAQVVISGLESLGISIKQVADELEKEGVKSFSESFAALFETLATRKKQFIQQLGPLKSFISQRIKKLQATRVIENLNQGNPTLWTKDLKGQLEFKSRIGWLHSAERTLSSLADMNKFVKGCLRRGFTHALLLGMGGSSLAAEVFAEIFPQKGEKTLGGLDLKIIDTTNPDQITGIAQSMLIEKTLIIVSSKSGTTVEVDALMNYFWQLVQKKLRKKTGKHFIAITDPNTPLEKTSRERKFARVFFGDPKVGGRYSALTNFGMVPAALMGIDVPHILEQAARMIGESGVGVHLARNPGVVLGAVLGEAALRGRDKLTFFTDPEYSCLGSWVEQLIAESSGKQGKGIIPVVDEPQTDIQKYGKDRLFVYIRKNGSKDEFCNALAEKKQPILIFQMDDQYSIGAFFYEWEIATVIACQVLGVNPFDQPDVQMAKTLAHEKLEQYKVDQFFFAEKAIWEDEKYLVYGKKSSAFSKARTVNTVIDFFLKQAKANDYISIIAFVPRNSKNRTHLKAFRESILLKTGNATTLGFGPRYLHSTGQLHKGGKNNGLFILLTQDPLKDVSVPDQQYSFGILERGQALGDFESLLSRNRKVIRVHTKEPLDWLNER
jgi:transaldolase/glucose-6-phosphate isomerase